MKHLTIYTSGKTKENPGPAAIGVFVTDDTEKTVVSFGESIGNANSSYAEFFAVLRGLQSLQEKYGENLEEYTVELLFSDETMYKQLTNKIPITSASLVPFFIEIHNMRITSFPNLTITCVKREINKNADRLANEALD